MKNYSKRTLLVNTFGTLGYFSCILSWSWVGLLYVPMLLENEQVERLLLPKPTEETVSHVPTIAASPFVIILASIVTVIILLVTIFVLLKLPSAVAKTGKTVTTKAATSALPLITRGHQLPPAKKKRLTANLIKIVKLLLVLLPVGATLLGGFMEFPLPFDIVLIVSSVLALFALLWFSAQYISARLLGVDVNILV